MSMCSPYTELPLAHSDISHYSCPTDVTSISVKRADAASDIEAKMVQVELSSPQWCHSSECKELESQRDVNISHAKLKAYQKEEFKNA